MPTIRPIIKHGKPCFEIDFGIVAGKKRRRYEMNMRRARQAVREFENQRHRIGVQWAGLEPRTKWTTLEVLAEIKECGLTVKEVWDSYQKRQLTTPETTIEEALTEFLEVKDQSGRRSRYTGELARVLNRFAKGREKRHISSVSAQELRSCLGGLDASQSTKQTVQNRVSSFFGWAYRQGYTKENPCEKLEKIRLDQADPEILTVKQCQTLIQATRKTAPDFLPYFALALFKGIRPEECARLTAKDIDLEREQITVSGKAAKTRNRRIVPLLPPALSILNQCPKTRWFNWKTNFRRRRDAIRKAAKLKKWPKDVLRHTAASHFYNIYGMDEATKALGHSAAIMLRHYRAMQTKEETQRWLQSNV